MKNYKTCAFKLQIERPIGGWCLLHFAINKKAPLAFLNAKERE